MSEPTQFKPVMFKGQLYMYKFIYVSLSLIYYKNMLQ